MMITKLTLAVGFGAGYVLGAKAGTDRYEQIVSLVDGVRRKPAVQQATDSLHHTATDFADKAKEAVNEQVDKVLGMSVDLTEKTPEAPRV